MTGTTTETAGSTAVTIYGRTYHLRGEGDPAYLARLAEMVDQKMREVADSTGTADTLKVAILAALNLADDHVQNRDGPVPEGTEEAHQRLARIVSLLDEALPG